MSRRAMSRAHVQFTGGPAEARASAQAVLDKEYNDETMLGHVEVTLHWKNDRWQLVSATMHPTAVGTGSVIPKVPPPEDVREEVKTTLTDSGVPVE